MPKQLKLPERKFTYKQVQDWRISLLPGICGRRDWLGQQEIVNLILYAYAGMEDYQQGKAMLELGVVNGIIEVRSMEKPHPNPEKLNIKWNEYRIKPAAKELG